MLLYTENRVFMCLGLKKDLSALYQPKLELKLDQNFNFTQR